MNYFNMFYYVLTAAAAFTFGHMVGYDKARKQLKSTVEILERIAEKYDWGNAKICK